VGEIFCQLFIWQEVNNQNTGSSKNLTDKESTNHWIE
jgi:hypothetical protein